MGSLTLRTRTDDTDDSVTVLSLSGELDLATVPQLREAARVALTGAGAPGSPAALVLDCAELTFLDSTGLGCWIELRNLADSIGGSLQLRSVPKQARRTVMIAGLAPLLGIGTTPDAPAMV